MLWRDGIHKHFIHSGFGGGHIAVARKDAGLLDGGLGVALGGGRPQFGGNRGVWNQLAGTRISLDGFRIAASGVGFIAFPQEFLRFVNGSAAARNLACGEG